LKYFLLFILISYSGFAQTDWQRWEKSEASYAPERKPVERSYRIDGSNPVNVFLKGAAVSYWVFVSDVDGDNCPFTPSCSSFFLESVKESNIIQGTLLFADRFTRDFNVFNRNDYHVTRFGRLDDPPEKYLVTIPSHKLP